MAVNQKPPKNNSFFTQCPQWGGIVWIQLVSFLALLLTTVWVLDSSFLGKWSGVGFTFTTNYLQNWKTFNWHPILVILGLVFTSNAITSFKVIPLGYSRMYHIALNFLAAFCITSSFYVSWSFVETNQLKKGHLATIHSWIGFLAFICYCLQFVLAYLVFVIFSYCSPRFSFFNELKTWLSNKHKFFGVLCWFLFILSVITGIVERQEIFQYYQLKDALSTLQASYSTILAFSYLTMFACVMYVLFYTKQDQLHEYDSYDPIGNMD